LQFIFLKGGEHLEKNVGGWRGTVFCIHEGVVGGKKVSKKIISNYVKEHIQTLR